jgi:Vps52 / Sac2 family.
MSFQSDLGSISSEILYLQRKSVSMSQQLHNRQAVRGRLSQFIDDMAVSETLIVYVRHLSSHMRHNMIFIVK